MSNTFDGWTLRQEYQRCGKTSCRNCPHGPYWYGYRSQDGKTRKKYFGKRDPRGEQSKQEDAHKTCQMPQGPAHPHDEIFDKRKATVALAYSILGFDDATASWEQIVERKNQYVRWFHPDRGGSEIVMKRINCAFELLRDRFGRKG